MAQTRVSGVHKFGEWRSGRAGWKGSAALFRSTAVRPEGDGIQEPKATKVSPRMEEITVTFQIPYLTGGHTPAANRILTPQSVSPTCWFLLSFATPELLKL